MNIHRTNQRDQGGFSLLEVLVAAAVGTGIILMMATTMQVGTSGFDQATRRIDALVEARAALGILADDAATMIGGGTDEFGWAESDDRFHEIWFLTLKPISAQDPDRAVGDVCLVHYFTAITPDAPVTDAAISRKLYRRFLSSADLLSRLNSGTLQRPEADPERAEIVAFNVTRFVAQPLIDDTNIGPLSEWEPGNGIPTSLGVDFQVVDGDTAALFRREEDWNIQSNVAQELLLEINEEDESSRGRDFRLNLEIGHEG